MTVEKKNIILAPFNILYRISPRLTLKILFKLKLGYKLNLKNPKTFNEKLQWLKLNYKNQFYPKLVDKYTVREYVSKLYPEILNTIYWEGFDPYQIPWDDLPNKFVIKVTHGSGFNIICRNKNKLNKRDIEKNLKRWLKTKYLKCYGEWFYGVERPRILIEKYIETCDDKSNVECIENDKPNILKDYKIFCFNGNPQIILVCSERFSTSGLKENFYDIEWNLLNLQRPKNPNTKEIIEKPTNLDAMLKIAKDLSKNLPFVRVDLYNIKGKIYFGELTFFPASGFGKFTPEIWDYKLGEWIELPINEN